MSKLRSGRRLGVPTGAVALAGLLALALILVAVMATGNRGERLMETARDLTGDRFAALGLRVGEVHLQGASKAAQDEIMAAAGVKLGAPILGVDLAAVRARVEAVGWVERARVIRLFPDTLVIAVTERPLMAVWQHAGRAVLVATNGSVTPHIDPAGFAKLPLIVGDGANVAAHGFIALMQAHPRLLNLTRAMVRVDRRRWDLRLADGAVVSLPATDEAGALKRLEAMDASSHILGLRFARIDLRDPEMVVLRPRGGVPAASVS